jgi:hypothetical protein
MEQWFGADVSVRVSQRDRLNRPSPSVTRGKSEDFRWGGVRRSVVALLGGVVQKNVAAHTTMRAHFGPEQALTFERGASDLHRGRWKSRQVALALAIVVSCMATASPARAELNLRWDAPPNCPRRDEVLDRIRALAGSSLDHFEGLSAEGRIARTNGRFLLTLSVRDGRQHRRRVITSDSCANLAGAAAITLALLLGVDTNTADTSAQSDARGQAAPQDGEPDQAERNGRATSAARGEQQSERDAKERDRRSEEPERDRASVDSRATPDRSSDRRWNVLIRAPIVAADLGPLPEPSVGLGLGTGIGYESWRFLLMGHLYRAQVVRAGDPGSAFAAGADLDRMTAQLAVCRGWRSPPFEIAPCLGLAVERTSARGFGQGVAPETQSAMWVAPSAGAVLHWYALKSLALFVGAHGDLELSRPRIVIDGLGDIGQLGPVSARVTTGLEWIL